MGRMLRTVGAVLLTAALVYLGIGLQGVLLPLRGVAEGFSTTVLGLLGSAYSLGFIAGCLGGPAVIRRVGHVRALAVFAAVAANVLLVHALLPVEAVWLVLRTVGGAALAAMFLVIESWLNESAGNAERGRVFGAYMVVNFTALVGGQLLVGLDDPRAFTLFALACIAISLGLVPVGLTTAVGPAPLGPVRLRLDQPFRLSPVGASGAVLVGVASGAFGTLAPVFLTRVGFGAFDIALFMGAVFTGAALTQFPIGLLSDRLDRRVVIAVTAALSAGVGVWMALSDGQGPASATARWLGLDLGSTWILGGFLFGSFAYPLYGVAVAHVNDHVEAGGFVEASSAVLMLWSLGATAGPILAVAAMGAFGANALFATTAAAHLGLAAFALYRLTRNGPPPNKGRFVPTGVARTTPAAVGLDPRSPSE